MKLACFKYDELPFYPTLVHIGLGVRGRSCSHQCCCYMYKRPYILYSVYQ